MTNEERAANLSRWKYIARDLAEDQDCWIMTHKPRWEQDGGIWALADKGACGFASDLGIHEELWPAPGECRRIRQLQIQILLETEAMDK